MIRCSILVVAVTLALHAAAGSGAHAQSAPPKLDVPYEGTPMPVVHQMLRLAKVGAADFLIDLGCGDGRIPVTAAKVYGARAHCVDLDPRRVREATARVAHDEIADRVEVAQGDLFETDLARATVITLFLWPTVNQKLRPKLLRLAPGTRIVSLDHDMGDWRPDRLEMAPHRTLGATPLHLWIVPADVGGRWRLAADAAPELDVDIRQRFQFITGTNASGATIVRAGRLTGGEISLQLRSATGGWRSLTGRVLPDGRMEGPGWTATRQPD